MADRKPVTAVLCFSLAVVRDENRYLLIQERKFEQRWYLPAGRLEPGETFAVGAVRETLEEAGLPIRLTGLIRLETSATPAARRFRASFLAVPARPTPLKSIADQHSLRAVWVTLSQLREFPLRGAEVQAILEYVDRDGAVAPLSVLGAAGDLSWTLGV